MAETKFFSNLKQVFLIAEIGVNHNGDMDLAKQMILAAKESGANAVKFQTYTSESLVADGTPKVDYQKETTDTHETHFEMLKKLELSKNDHVNLFNFCKTNEIIFLSTPYGVEEAKFLFNLGVNFFKTASADIVDHILHNYIASTNIPSIIATGMASIEEIEEVVNIYRNNDNNNFILLHCVSNYPCSDGSLNMNAIHTIKNKFSCDVGYSDHSNGDLAATISVAHGAKVIEKHFTLDKSLQGPDHKASSTPKEFKKLVNNVRRAEKILGNHSKKMQPEELQMAQVSRKSIFLSKDLKKNDVLCESDLALKRPGDGILANKIGKICGLKLKYDLKKDHMLHWDDLF